MLKSTSAILLLPGFAALASVPEGAISSAGLEVAPYFLCALTSGESEVRSAFEGPFAAGAAPAATSPFVMRWTEGGTAFEAAAHWTFDESDGVRTHHYLADSAGLQGTTGARLHAVIVQPRGADTFSGSLVLELAGGGGAVGILTCREGFSRL